MTGRDPGAAHGDDILGVFAPEAFCPAAPQFRRRQEAAVGREIVRKGMIYRAGNVPGDGIDGFDRPAKALGGAGIDQKMRRVAAAARRLARC